MTKPTTNLTREELLAALRGGAINFDDEALRLIDTYTQAKEREARMDQLDKLIDIESKTFNQWTQTDIANFFHEVGRQYRDLEAENENL